MRLYRNKYIIESTRRTISNLRIGVTEIIIERNQHSFNERLKRAKKEYVIIMELYFFFCRFVNSLLWRIYRSPKLTF